VAENSLYVVCDNCGFFHGDLRLHETAAILCPDCGAEDGRVFARIEKALAYKDLFPGRVVRESEWAGIADAIETGEPHPTLDAIPAGTPIRVADVEHFCPHGFVRERAPHSAAGLERCPDCDSGPVSTEGGEGEATGPQGSER